MGKRRVLIGTDPELTNAGESETVIFNNGYEQWLVDGNVFFPVTKTTKLIPAGHYFFQFCSRRDRYGLALKNFPTEELYNFPSNDFEEVVKDVRTFWNSKDKYKKFNYVYKRGILLYGPPGCGKTSLISLLAKELIKENGVVIWINQPRDLYGIDGVLSDLREIEPNRPLIIIFEDIDNFANCDPELVTRLLNFLDGNIKFDNYVTIGTTNYPQRLEERISNRPSRFAVKKEIKLPNKLVRKYYLETKLKGKISDKIINEWVNKTEGMSIDHLKELILLVCVNEIEFETAIKEINTVKIKNTTGTGTKKIGFGNRNGEIIEEEVDYSKI